MALGLRTATNFNRKSAQIGAVFLQNCRGITVTKGPDRWDASWENNAAGLHSSLPATKGDWYAAEAGLQLLLELTDLRVLGLDQAEVDRLVCLQR